MMPRAFSVAPAIAIFVASAFGSFRGAPVWTIRSGGKALNTASHRRRDQLPFSARLLSDWFVKYTIAQTLVGRSGFVAR